MWLDMQELWESLHDHVHFYVHKARSTILWQSKSSDFSICVSFIMSDEIRKEILGNEWDGFIFVSRKFQYKNL